jgi:hypothetical protein
MLQFLESHRGLLAHGIENLLLSVFCIRVSLVKAACTEK